MTNAKQFLMQVRNINKRLTALEQELQEIRKDIQHIQAVNYDKDRVCGGRQTDISDLIVRYEIAAERCNVEWDRLIQIREEVSHVINQVDDNILHTLLKERYINGRTWDQVAILTGYVRGWVINALHPKALEEVQKILKESTKVNCHMC